jgi:hypothetical protein
VSAGTVYARLKDNPDIRRQLEDVRTDLACAYEMRYGQVPSRTVLGDAMTVLVGQARRAVPDPAGAQDEAATLLSKYEVHTELHRRGPPGQHHR